MLLAPVVWILTVVIAYFFAAKTWWFPMPINQHGAAYDDQFMRTLVVTGIIFILAQFALGWVIFKFRDDGRRAEHFHGNNKLETLWTSATAVLFIGLVLMGTKIWAGVHFDEPPADAVPIEVMAKQFAWSFRYPGPDGKFGTPASSSSTMPPETHSVSTTRIPPEKTISSAPRSKFPPASPSS